MDNLTLKENLAKLDSFINLQIKPNSEVNINKCCIEVCRNILPKLIKQPDIFPTLKNTIQFEYENSNTYLEFEIFETNISCALNNKYKKIRYNIISYKDINFKRIGGKINSISEMNTLIYNNHF